VPEGRTAGVSGGAAAGIAGGVVGGTGTDPVPVAQVAEPPVLVRRVPPVYPRDARRREIDGLVLLQAVLDRDGRVERDVRVLQSVPMLDDEAVVAVRQWRFRPARNGRGEPLRVILEIPIRFVLN
jgi:protein TonB